MDQYQSRFLAVGQPEVNELAGRGVVSRNGFHPEARMSLLPFPLPNVPPRIAVRDAALGLDRVNEVDAFGEDRRRLEKRRVYCPENEASLPSLVARVPVLGSD